MAVTKTIEASSITALREQTWRVNFEIPNGGEPSIQIYRETVPLDAEGNVVGQPQQSYTPVNRTFAAVQDEVAEGTGLAFSDVVETLAIFGDKWAEEDAAAPAEGPAGRRAAPPEPPPPAPRAMPAKRKTVAKKKATAKPPAKKAPKPTAKKKARR